MSDQSSHELMESYVGLAAEEARYRQEKADVLEDVGDRLAEGVEDAVDLSGGKVYPDSNFSKF